MRRTKLELGCGAGKSLCASLMLLLSLTCCAPAGDVEASRGHGSQASVSAAACRGSGGIMKPVGRLQTLQCVTRFQDAGRRCNSGRECQGDCQVRAGDEALPGQPVFGVCQPTSERFGCTTSIEDGRAQATICID
jgi:hypothetical protein